MFRVLGFILIIWLVVAAVGLGLVIHYYLPHRRKKHISQLEAENQRLDQLLSVTKQPRREPR